MYIQYKDILIRNVEESDCKQLADWWNDGNLMAHAGFPDGLGTTEEEVKEKVSNDSDDTIRRMVILYKDKLIGETNFTVCEDNRYEIGIKICDNSYQEKGLGKIVLSLLIEEYFKRGASKVFLDTNLNNERAQHVYEKLGFKKVATHLNAWKDQRGKLMSSCDYEMTPEDFINLKETEYNKK